jgi:hypothetical protein
MAKSTRLWLLIGGLLILALAAGALLLVSNSQQSPEAYATGTQQFADSVINWCGTNVINECFEPGCTPPPMSFGECRFYYLDEQARLATRQAISTPSP